MQKKIKNIAIIGANKESLSLLPLLLKDNTRSRVCIIADQNREAMLFKLNELGYRISSKLDIKTTTDLEELKKIPDLSIIINASRTLEAEKLLKQALFRNVEKLGPLSARLIWGSRASAAAVLEIPGVVDGQSALLASLREIVDAVRLTVDRRELLSVILKLAIESTRADRGSIMILAKDEGVLRVDIAEGMDEEVIRKIRVKLGEGISGRVARDGKPLLISGKADDKEFQRLRERTDVKSALCVPLSVNGETIGVINVNTSESKLAFSQDDLAFLTRLSELAAEVIHRSNEYDKMKVDSAKLSLWKETDSIMSSFVPLERRLNTICKKLSDVVPGLTCFIYIYDEDRKRLSLKSSSIKDINNFGPLNLADGEGVEGSLIKNRKDVILVERTHDDIFKRIYLSLPLISDGEFIGTLNGQIVSPEGLSVYHESFIKDIRDLIAQRLYKHKQRKKESLRSLKMFAVDETGLEMVTMRDQKKLVNIIATAPAAILGAEGSILRLKNYDSGPYRIAASYGVEDNNVRNYFIPYEKEAVMEVLRKKKLVNRVFSEEASSYIRAIISYPLKIDEKIVGVLTLFNKIDDGSIFPCCFSKVDVEILSRFAVYAEKSLMNLFKIEPGIDAQLKRPALLPLALFERRVDEEINRARRSSKNLVIATVRVSGLKTATLHDRTEFESNFLSLMKDKVRNFDLVVWLDDETIGLLFIDTDEKVVRMLGSIPEALRAEKNLYKSFRGGNVEIFYGYASFPDDGDSFTALFSKASKRIKVKFGGLS